MVPFIILLLAFLQNKSGFFTEYISFEKPNPKFNMEPCVSPFFLMNSLQFGATSYVDMNANKSLLTGVAFSSEPPSSTSPGPLPGPSPVCLHCYQWLQPDNHRIRLRPKPRPSQYVQRVLRRNARGKRLSLVQKNLLRRFQTASSALVRRHHTSATSVWADWPSTHLHTHARTLLPSFYLILSFL